MRRTAVQIGVLRYKWEVYCGVSLSSRLRSQQGTALQMGGVPQYKLEVYCQYFSDKLYGLGVPGQCPFMKTSSLLHHQPGMKVAASPWKFSMWRVHRHPPEITDAVLLALLAGTSFVTKVRRSMPKKQCSWNYSPKLRIKRDSSSRDTQNNSRSIICARLGDK